jgi:hypothetical protein
MDVLMQLMEVLTVSSQEAEAWKAPVLKAMRSFSLRSASDTFRVGDTTTGGEEVIPWLLTVANGGENGNTGGVAEFLGRGEAKQGGGP